MTEHQIPIVFNRPASELAECGLVRISILKAAALGFEVSASQATDKYEIRCQDGHPCNGQMDR